MSSLNAHVILLVLSCAGSFNFFRLEKSAEEFQTSADKQKARVFQDEVRFLQKIIEKASKKFRRRKLKFGVNKDVKKFFDDLESIGNLETEVVDVNAGESTNKDKHDERGANIKDANAQTREAHCSRKTDAESFKDNNSNGDTTRNSDNNETKMQLHYDTENSTHEGNERLIIHNNQQKTDPLSDKVTNKYTEGKHIEPVQYESKPVTTKDVVTANFDASTKSENKPTETNMEKNTAFESIAESNQESKLNLQLTEADWKQFRDLELNKTRFNPDTKEETPKTSLKISNRGKDDTEKHKPDRISVLQELCKRLDTQNKYSSSQTNKYKSNIIRHTESKAVSTEDEMFSNATSGNTRNGGTQDRNDIASLPTEPHATDNSNNKFRCSDDSAAVNQPKGIIKNWMNDNNNLRRSKSDSSKYSYLRDKKHFNDRKGDLHVKFADAVDHSEDTEIEHKIDADDNVDNSVSGKGLFSRPENNPNNGFQETSQDASSNLKADALQFVNESGNFSGSTFWRDIYSTLRVSSEHCTQDKPILKVKVPDDNLLQKLKHALDNFKQSDIVKSKNDDSSSLLSNADGNLKQTVTTDNKKQLKGQTVITSRAKLDSNRLKSDRDETDLDQSRNEALVSQRPKPDIFDLNNFRTTLESLKEEIITTRKKHEKHKPHAYEDESNDSANKATIEKPETERSDSDLCTDQPDSESAALNDQQDSESPALTDQQDSESSVSEDSVRDFKAQRGRYPSQSNGLKVSNARIAAYVRRRLKAIELPSPFPATSLTSSLTGPLSKHHIKGISKEFADVNSENNGALASASHSEVMLGSNSQDTVQKQTRTNKQRLPSSEEMLFDL